MTVREVRCQKGHRFTTDTSSLWDGLYCPEQNDARGPCLAPLIDSSTHLIQDLIDLRGELE